MPRLVVLERVPIQIRHSRADGRGVGRVQSCAQMRRHAVIVFEVILGNGTVDQTVSGLALGAANVCVDGILMVVFCEDGDVFVEKLRRAG